MYDIFAYKSNDSGGTAWLDRTSGPIHTRQDELDKIKTRLRLLFIISMLIIYFKKIPLIGPLKAQGTIYLSL